MTPALRRALRWAGWTLVWGAALAGLLLSAAALLAVLPATRPRIAEAIIRQVDEAVAGRLELDAIAVLPHGGVEVRGLRVFDPEGALVLRVDRARLFVDELGLAARVVALSAELEGVEADAARRDRDGELAIAAAFAPVSARPRPPGSARAPRAPPPGAEGSGWAVRVGRLAITNGRLLAVGAGREPLDARSLTLEARGLWAPRAAWVEARIGGELAAPARGPLAIALRASRGGDHLELQRLDVRLGADRLEAVGEGDLARRSGRLAVTRLGLSKRDAGALAPIARLGAELSGTVYAESDGAVATAALDVAPAGGEGPGRARVAAATRLPPAAAAWGIFGDVDRLDPSRLSLLAPPGRVTLRGRGAWKGTRLAELTGRLDVRLERSRLRGGEVGPAELQASARSGNVEVAKLELAAPGGSVGGRLRWREGGDVAGRLEAVAGDLDALEKNLAAALGRPIPDLQGSGRADVALSGTSAAPRLEAKVDAARLRIGRVRCEGARLSVELRGPAASAEGRIQGGLASAEVGGVLLRGVDLDAALGAAEGSLSFTANAPQLGSELLRVMLRGRFGPRRAWFDLGDAAFAWPGTRFELQAPARIDLIAPSVDRLALVSGPQRMELAGGLAPDGKLDARLRLGNLDLEKLPRGLVPEAARLAGLLTLDARASGSRAAPRVDATLGLTGGAAYDVGGLQLLGDVSWDGAQERIEGDLGLVRERGGAVDLSFDLPVALGGARKYEEVRVELRGRTVPLDELVWLAGSYALVSGDVDATATLTGSVGNPALRATVAVRNGTWDDLEGLTLDATVDAPGDRLRLRAAGAVAGAGTATAEAELALDLPGLIARPREELDALRRRPFSLAVGVPAVALAPLAGRLELPPDLAGRLEGAASLGGSLAAPRGTAHAYLREGSGWGARAVAGRLDLALAPERTGATLELSLAGAPAARLDAALDLPVERLLDRAALPDAHVRATLALPRSDLAAWGGELITLRGSVEGRAAVGGTLGAPQADLTLSAADVAVEGRSLGAVVVTGRYAARRTAVGVDLRPPAGGTLHADAALDRPLGLGASAGPLGAAPAEVRVRAEQLDLGFLPALAPGVVRLASGAVTLDLAAAGPLAELRPRGRLTVGKGRLAIAELGEWTDAEIEADLGDDAVRLTRFDVRKGKGRLSLRGALRWPALRGQPGEIEATLETDDFGLERAGQEFAKLDLAAEARGQVSRGGLTLGIVVPRADVKLPKRIPRSLQRVEARKDILVGRPRPARTRYAHAGPEREGAGQGAPRAEPFKTVLHVVAPRRLRVRADQPRIDVELKADAIFAFAGSREEATGSVEAIRGQVEPIGGRVFELERGKVTFTGGPIAAGTLDIATRWDNPTAKVRATVEGTIARPKLHLSAEPSLTEAQIAMLVATGRTEVKAGTGGVSALAPSDAGLAAVGAVVMGAFKELLSDKLPVDSVSVDSTAASAGKYLTDRIYVGYVRRFDAKPEKGENPDEVRIEYQLAPGWQVETRYGSGQSGGASIVWTKNY